MQNEKKSNEWALVFLVGLLAVGGMLVYNQFFATPAKAAQEPQRREEAVVDEEFTLKAGANYTLSFSLNYDATVLVDLSSDAAVSITFDGDEKSEGSGKNLRILTKQTKLGAGPHKIYVAADSSPAKVKLRVVANPK